MKPAAWGKRQVSTWEVSFKVGWVKNVDEMLVSLTKSLSSASGPGSLGTDRADGYLRSRMLWDCQAAVNQDPARGDRAQVQEIQTLPGGVGWQPETPSQEQRHGPGIEEEVKWEGLKEMKNLNKNFSIPCLKGWCWFQNWWSEEKDFHSRS